LLMTVPVLAYHLKIGSSVQRATVWLVATVVGTLVGMRLVHFVLANLP